MKKKIVGWILLAWGLLGLLLNLVFWLPYLTDASDIGFYLINSCVCVVFIVTGSILIVKGKRNIATKCGVDNG